MPNYPIFNLTGKTPENTFQNLVQTNAASSSLVDGLGNEIEFFNLTASRAVSSISSSFATSASWAPSNNSFSTLTASAVSLTATTASVPINTGSVVGWMTFQGGDGHTYYFPLYR